jgi:Fe-S-cluster-containing dehydrogenase component
MKVDRRQFFSAIGAGTLCACGASAAETHSEEANQDGVGMLVDVTQCIGCRKCEWACAKAGGLTDKPMDAFEDISVFAEARRMKPDSYTVVNRYNNPSSPEKPVFVKNQCMHCLDPACVSACVVGALHKETNGSVSYTTWKCIGCRYCMIACPFEVPTYEYENAFTPVVSKCTFCYDNLQKEGKIPACAEICPPMCLTFAKRSALLELAREKIAAHPDRYISHIYGEHEVGGTSWLYLLPRPPKELGLLELNEKPPPSLSEAIQHGVFKFGVPPLILFGLLGAAMKTFAPEDENGSDKKESGLTAFGDGDAK